MMKTLRRTLFAAAAATLLAGCANDLLPRGERGSFDGVWDGAAWKGEAYAVLQNDSLTVIAHRPDPRYFYDEYVQARVRFTGPGTYTVSESGGQLLKIVGGDAGQFPAASGTLVIREYDASAHTLTGDVTLHAGSVQPAWDASGTFNAHVYSSFNQVPSGR
ncbi:MAG TPA: hypothetical protein VFJ16_32025 [Longimicrobium sp.]|nr:hypothetical protein [Longimicrobium sp.]